MQQETTVVYIYMRSGIWEERYINIIASTIVFIILVLK